MAYYDDHGRPRHGRNRSPDYTYAGGSGVPYPPSDAPYGPSDNIRVSSPGHTSYYPPPPTSQPRLAYEPQSPLFPSGNLQVPDSRARPRSLPPPAEYGGGRSRHGRDRDRSRGRRGGGDDDDDDDDDRDIARDRSPIAKARHVLKDTFSDSTTGLGVGVLGALVGGLAAREAADATSRHGGYGHSTEAQKRTQLLSTVVGAAVGALGANAVEKRIETHREKDRIKLEKWEQKWGKRPGSSRGDGVARSSTLMSGGNGDVIEKREVVVRPGSRGRDWDVEDLRERDRRGRGAMREVDPDARSWKDVEDWVYDDRDRRDSRGRRESRRSQDEYRY